MMGGRAPWKDEWKVGLVYAILSQIFISMQDKTLKQDNFQKIFICILGVRCQKYFAIIYKAILLHFCLEKS